MGWWAARVWSRSNAPTAQLTSPRCEAAGLIANICCKCIGKWPAQAGNGATLYRLTLACRMKQIHIERVERDAALVDEMENEIVKFLGELDEAIADLRARYMKESA